MAIQQIFRIRAQASDFKADLAMRHQINTNDLYCNQCSNCIEDSFHVLMQCTRYKKARFKLISVISKVLKIPITFNLLLYGNDWNALHLNNNAVRWLDAEIKTFHELIYKDRKLN